MEIAVKLKIESLTFPPDPKLVLKDIDLTIRQGDFVAIAGEAAAGKSLLLHSITGAAEHFFHGQLRGDVWVMGRNIRDVPLTQMCDYIGYMMQEPQNQIISNTVAEEVAFGIANMELPWPEIAARVNKALEFVGLEDFEARNTGQLSGGQAQRVVLASVLAMETPILVLDQPTAELDGKGKQELYAHLGYLNKEKGVTVIIVMDRASDILPYADRVLIMADGTVKEECSPADYRFRLIKKQIPVKPKAASEVNIVEVKGLSFTYRGGGAGCQEIDFAIKQGESLGIIGLNGSGKTTLLKLMEGLLIPDTGSIQILGIPLISKNLDTIRSRVGFIFQNPDLQIFANTVTEEVAFTLRTRKLPLQTIEERVKAVLAEVGLTQYADVHPHKLSRSQRQKLAIASVLAGDPELILADEPTSSLDEDQSALIMELLFRFQQQGKTVVLVTHDLGLAQHYTDRIIALHKHRLVMDIPTDRISDYEKSLKDVGLDFDPGYGKEGMCL